MRSVVATAREAAARTGRRAVVLMITTTVAMGLCSLVPAGSRVGVIRPPSASDEHVAPVAYSAIRPARLVAVENAYRTRFAANAVVRPNWSGSTDACAAGRPSPAYAQATLESLNFVRELAHLAPVSLSSTLSGRAQKAALIMAANRALSHDPPPSWRCWTTTGADAASKSNLAFAGTRLSAARTIELYMDDPGPSNSAVGHRRWLLYPKTRAIGIGATDDASAVWVLGPTSRLRPNPAWVGWPTAGYFPAPLEPNGRWSLSAGSSRMRFGHAIVRVYHGTTRVRIHKYRALRGYGKPTIVWQMPSGFSRAGTYRVVVSRITKSGSSKMFRHAYSVKLFNTAL